MDAVRWRCDARDVIRISLVLAIACCLAAAWPAVAQTVPEAPVVEPPPPAAPQTHQDPAAEVDTEAPQSGIGDAVVEQGGQGRGEDQEVLGERRAQGEGAAPAAEQGPSPAPPAPAATGTETLPFTGVDPLPLALMGVLLLSAGLFLRKAGDQRAG
jgi:hypothetical protein